MNLKVIVPVVVAVVVAVILMAVLIPRTCKFRKNFVEKCKSFPVDSTRCKNLLDTFQKTYESKGPYNFPETNYEPVFAAAPFTHPGAKTLLWSKTGDLAHKFSKNGDCLFTLEDTLLGSVLNGQRWCGLKGLKGTYEPFCKLCNNNTVDSFWRRASVKFARHAEGTVTAMLNGDAGQPVKPDSFFRSIEVTNLTYPQVTRLRVILVTNKQEVCANDPSLKELKEAIDPRISYTCTAVPRVEIMTASYAAGQIRIQIHGRRNEDTVSHYVNIDTEPPENKRRRICCGSAFIVAAVIIIAVAIWLAGRPQTFSKRFISKCLKYKKENNESYCQRVFDVFERAYIGKPESNVSTEDYDDLMAEVPFDYPCNQTMFWSNTSELVHKYTDKDEGKKDCFTQEDALLGYILNNEIWCGKEGSNETFTDGCQGFNYTGNSAVLSFWNRASVAFAEYACGDATVMLDGSLETPFYPNSTFARFEVNRLKHPKVTKLNVILVSGDKSNCTADNLNIDLALDSNISCSCNDVTESRVTECSTSSSDTDVGCVACLLKPAE